MNELHTNNMAHDFDETWLVLSTNVLIDIERYINKRVRNTNIEKVKSIQNSHSANYEYDLAAWEASVPKDCFPMEMPNKERLLRYSTAICRFQYGTIGRFPQFNFNLRCNCDEMGIMAAENINTVCSIACHDYHRLHKDIKVILESAYYCREQFRKRADRERSILVFLESIDGIPLLLRPIYLSIRYLWNRNESPKGLLPQHRHSTASDLLAQYHSEKTLGMAIDGIRIGKIYITCDHEEGLIEKVLERKVIISGNNGTAGVAYEMDFGFIENKDTIFLINEKIRSRINSMKYHSPNKTT
jgi:hypothetical protein